MTTVKTSGEKVSLITPKSRNGISHSSKKPLIQPKLKIGAPDDPYEREADAMADKVMSMPASEVPIQRKCHPCAEEETQQKPLAGQITPLVQRQAFPEEQEEPIQPKLIQRQSLPEEQEEPIQPKFMQREAPPIEQEEPIQPKANQGIQRNENGEGSTSPSFESKLNSSKGGGQKLPDDTRGFMESRFGADFSGVRVHTDNNAIQMNQAVGARAFTHGNDIHFNHGKYNPNSSSGRHLLAHELTHVLQQKVCNATKQVQCNSIPWFKIIDESRENIVNQTKSGLAASARNFQFAAGLVISKYKSLERANARLGAVLLDVAMGFGIPHLSTYLAGHAGRLLANKLITKSSYWMLRKFLENKDMTKAFFTGTVKLTGDITRRYSNYGPAGESESISFVKSLWNDFNSMVKRVNGNLHQKSLFGDKELSFLWMMHYDGIINLDYYEILITDMVERFKSEVKPIGNFQYRKWGYYENRAYWIKARSWDLNGKIIPIKRMAIVTYYPDKRSYAFRHWVSPDLLCAAKKKSAYFDNPLKKPDKHDKSNKKLNTLDINDLDNSVRFPAFFNEKSRLWIRADQEFDPCMKDINSALQH